MTHRSLQEFLDIQEVCPSTFTLLQHFCISPAWLLRSECSQGFISGVSESAWQTFIILWPPQVPPMKENLLLYVVDELKMGKGNNTDGLGVVKIGLGSLVIKSRSKYFGDPTGQPKVTSVPLVWVRVHGEPDEFNWKLQKLREITSFAPVIRTWSYFTLIKRNSEAEQQRLRQTKIGKLFIMSPRRLKRCNWFWRDKWIFQVIIKNTTAWVRVVRRTGCNHCCPIIWVTNKKKGILIFKITFSFNLRPISRETLSAECSRIYKMLAGLISVWFQNVRYPRFNIWVWTWWRTFFLNERAMLWISSGGVVKKKCSSTPTWL